MRKLPRKSHGRGKCRFCGQVKNLTKFETLEPHPVPGNASGASRCGGTGLRPVTVAAVAL